MNLFSRYFWRELYLSVKNYFFPRNKWLTRHIPKAFQDKDVLLENILAATIIDFVDVEEGLSDIVWINHPSELDASHKLINAYHWFKWKRPALEEKENQLLAHDFPRLQTLGQINNKKSWPEYRANLRNDFAAKKEILDNLHFQNIVKYRKHLWT